MKPLLKKSPHFLVFLVILGFTLYFRLGNLGYSDFQGDEVAAQNYLFGEQNSLAFILSRPVGPGQYLVSFVANVLAHGGINKEFWVRLPFSLAGILLCVSVYLLVKRHLEKTSAIFSFLLVSLSGLLIAFSRIVQYQSFVILLSVICAYMVFEYSRARQPVYLVIAGLLSGLGLLFHYDYLAFLIPLALFLFKNCEFKKTLRLFILPVLFVAGIFYLPYMASPYFKSTASHLLMGRISSDFNYDSIYYSYKLFSIYHPKEFIALFLFTALVGIFQSVRKSRYIIISTILLAFLILGRFLLVKPFVPIIAGSLIMSTILLVLYYKKLTADLKSFLGFWALFAFTIYGLFIRMPLTHMYVYVFPALILLGVIIGDLVKKSASLSRPVHLGVLIIVIFIYHYNHQAFINTNPEFPWNTKTYLGGKMPMEIAGGAEIEGVFGFPYNRGWKNISSDLVKIKASCKNVTYNSNEKYRLAKYYIQGIKWVEQTPDVYVWINKSQSMAWVDKPHSLIIKETSSYTLAGECL